MVKQHRTSECPRRGVAVGNETPRPVVAREDVAIAPDGSKQRVVDGEMWIRE